MGETLNHPSNNANIIVKSALKEKYRADRTRECLPEEVLYNLRSAGWADLGRCWGQGAAGHIPTPEGQSVRKCKAFPWIFSVEASLHHPLRKHSKGSAGQRIREMINLGNALFFQYEELGVCLRQRNQLSSTTLKLLEMPSSQMCSEVEASSQLA